MIPVVDTLDPDQRGEPEIVEERQKNTESIESIEARHKDKLTADEFLKKHGLDKKKTVDY